MERGCYREVGEKNERNKSEYQHIAFSQKDTESNQIENQEDIEIKIKQK